MIKVHAALPEFYYAPATPDEEKKGEGIYKFPDDSVSYIRGLTAVKRGFNDEAKKSEHDLAALKRFVPYQHLMDPADSSRLDAMVNQIMKDANRKRKTGATDSVMKSESAPKKKAKAKAKPSTACALSSAADALLYSM
eukprot:4146521-Amphidinium_carterae.1